MSMWNHTDVETKLLSSTDLKGVAEFIKSGKCKKIAILAGAGISVSAGIPDFRSSDGFYNTLNTDDFPMLTKEEIKRIENDPEYIFSINLFKKNPSVYLHARKEFLLSGFKYKPTLTHWFFKLLENKKLLKRFYSTNIDGLDVATNISSDILIHIHGTCGSVICYKCQKQYDMNKLKELLEKNVHLKQFITCDKCENELNFIKPNTVLFGERLPSIFGELVHKKKDLNDVDLLIIAGTSLSVSPSSDIPEYIDTNKCVRLLVNRERSGFVMDKKDILDGIVWDKNDVFYKGNCDDGFKELAHLLGWKNELNQLMQTNNNHDNHNEETKEDK